MDKKKTTKEYMDIEIGKTYSNDVGIKQVPKVTFGKYKVLISHEEPDILEKIYNDYVQKNGVSLGFIHALVGD
jgi:hypothetical protein